VGKQTDDEDSESGFNLTVVFHKNFGLPNRVIECRRRRSLYWSQRSVIPGLL